jgi:hypothetical protein
VPWPLSQDYNEAIQSPRTSFADAELRDGEAAVNALGMPVPCSGNFADVYRVDCPTRGRSWAVKCFTRQIPNLRQRYREVNQFLGQAKLPFLVDFTFLDQGIRIRGDWFPILKMSWVEGFTLNQFVRDNLDKLFLLEKLGQIWLKLARALREARVAHGDLQHGNVLLVPGAKAALVSVRLVDYDGLCVPALLSLRSSEAGHPAYQHPQRLREGTYNLEVDRFSHLVIYTALRALQTGDRALWERFDNGDNLLFCQKDFQNPDGSMLFRELAQAQNAEVRRLAEALRRAAQGPIEQVPLLEELVSEEQAAKPAAAGSGKAPPPIPAGGTRPSQLKLRVPDNAGESGPKDEEIIEGYPEETPEESLFAALNDAAGVAAPGRKNVQDRPRGRAKWVYAACVAGLSVLLFGAALFVLPRFLPTSGEASGDRNVVVAKGNEKPQVPGDGAPESPAKEKPDPQFIEPPPPPQVTAKGLFPDTPEVEKKKPAIAEPDPTPKKDKAPAEELPMETPPIKVVSKAMLTPEIQRQIEGAVTQGMVFLQSAQQPDGTWTGLGNFPVGYTALSALTLLECGVPKADRSIQTAAKAVRNRLAKLGKTYELALAILFLDKLGDSEDEIRIQSLALRLVAGQNYAGGWTYECPIVSPQLQQELLTFLSVERQWKLAPQATRSAQPPPVPGSLRLLPSFHPDNADPKFKKRSAPGDNCNTQFALLGLWAARRHDVPLERVFAFAEKRFRQSQNADGGWGYVGAKGEMGTTRTMGCAGLLGIAVGRGSRYELSYPDKPAQDSVLRKLATEDEAVRRALAGLGRTIGEPAGRTAELPPQNLYFLWSLGRVALIYDLRTIENKDWYLWGAEILLANQENNRYWTNGGYQGTHPVLDTCFALLFLKRAKLFPELGPPGRVVAVVKPTETPPVVKPSPAKAEPPPPLSKEVLGQIARGVQFLQKHQDADGSWQKLLGITGPNKVGDSALAGLTLLGCGVPRNDPGVQRAARFVRANATKKGITATHELPLALLFLDKLGDPGDEPLLETLVLHLVAGQKAWGGWEHAFFAQGEQTHKELASYFRAEKEWRQANPANAGEKLAAGNGRPRPSPALLMLPVFKTDPVPKNRKKDPFESHFTTQFALLGLWAARRHDLPLERTFAFVRRSADAHQDSDGGWGNQATMTCVGLLGLAIGRATEPALQDQRIPNGLKKLDRVIGNPSMENVYALWSVGQAAALFDLKTIGGKDWYARGAEVLRAKQQPDGGWNGGGYFGTNRVFDTCLALQFLQRLNLAPDLSERLR